MGACPGSMGSGYSITPSRQGPARSTLNRFSPRMLSRPSAAIIFPLASLNTSSVTQRKNNASPGDTLRRLPRPKWLPALLLRPSLPPKGDWLFSLRPDLGKDRREMEKENVSYHRSLNKKGGRTLPTGALGGDFSHGGHNQI